jgi:hypothetical protein
LTKRHNGGAQLDKAKLVDILDEEGASKRRTWHFMENDKHDLFSHNILISLAFSSKGQQMPVSRSYASYSLRFRIQGHYKKYNLQLYKVTISFQKEL